MDWPYCFLTTVPTLTIGPFGDKVNDGQVEITVVLITSSPENDQGMLLFPNSKIIALLLSNFNHSFCSRIRISIPF